MNDVKRKLLAEIDKRVARQKEVAARVLDKSMVEVFVLTFIKKVEEINSLQLNSGQWATLEKAAEQTLWGQLQSYDPMCKMDIVWDDPDSDSPQVHCVKISWSQKYQESTNCDPELFLDAISILLDD